MSDPFRPHSSSDPDPYGSSWHPPQPPHGDGQRGHAPYGGLSPHPAPTGYPPHSGASPYGGYPAPSPYTGPAASSPPGGPYAAESSWHPYQPGGPQAGPEPPPKKSRLGWILGGCGCLALIGILLFGGCVAILGTGGDSTTAAPSEDPADRDADQQSTTPEEAESPTEEAPSDAGEADQDTSEDAPAESEPEADPDAETAPEAETDVVDEPAEEAPAAAVGTPVTVGDLSLTVTDVETGLSSVGDPMWGTQANGEFIVVSVTITNESNSPESVFSNDFMLLDEAGAEFATSSDAWHVDDNLSWEEINPGNSFTGVLVYDVPAGTDPVSLQASVGWFSEPVVIDLAG